MNPFSFAARDYDRSFSSLPDVKELRERILLPFVKHLPPGGRILDIGCGTGDDAIRLAGLGFRVVGLDPAMGMLACAREKSSREQTRISLMRADAEHLTCFRASSFDGILANFGSLNCIPDLSPVLRTCAHALKLNGIATLTLINRHSVWEWGALFSRGQFRTMFRRSTDSAVHVPVGSGRVATWYHRISDVRRMAAPWFVVEQILGLNIISPPPSSRSFIRRHPHLTTSLSRVERSIESWPLIQLAGDHCVLVLRRTGNSMLGAS